MRISTRIQSSYRLVIILQIETSNRLSLLAIVAILYPYFVSTTQIAVLPRSLRFAQLNKTLIIVSYTRAESLFQAGQNLGALGNTVCGRSEGIRRVIFLIRAFCLVMLPYDDPVVGGIHDPRGPVHPSTIADMEPREGERENRNRLVSSLVRLAQVDGQTECKKGEK